MDSITDIQIESIAISSELSDLLGSKRSNEIVFNTLETVISSATISSESFITEKELISLCNDLHQLSMYDMSITYFASALYINHVLKPSALGSFSANIKRMGASIGTKYSKFVEQNAKFLDGIIDNERDNLLTWLSVCVMRRTYLMRYVHKNSPTDTNAVTYLCETPQQMFLREAVQIGYPDVHRIARVYDRYSMLEYTQATPTVFNACTAKNGLTSCFLSTIDDNMESIASFYSQIALISARGGGMGYSIGDIRHSEITNAGESKGVVDLLKTHAGIFQYIVQGGRRRASGTPYLPVHHKDVEKFIILGTKGPEEERIHSGMTFGLFVPDLFMERVAEGGKWSLFCPKRAPGLTDVYGDDFRKLYEYYEAEGQADKTVKAIDLLHKISLCWIETGSPYVMFKDAINRRTNQSNLGVVKTSNLCVTRETKILTREHGHIPIGDVVRKPVDIWNGRRWSSVTPQLTSVSSKIVEIRFESGRAIRCTPDHRFYIKGSIPNKPYYIRASLLKPGTVLEEWNVPDGYEHPEGLVVPDAFKTCDTVVSKQIIPGSHPTFCVKDDDRGRCMFNGMVTGNCTEIVQFCDKDNIASCNLGSISLPCCVCTDRFSNKFFDFAKLAQLTEEMVENIDNVIDLTFYIQEFPQIERCNKQNRPIGIGTQGLADVFAMMGISWESDRAYELNFQIYETMYYHAIRRSIELAKEKGSYTNFYTSPASKGWFQFDLFDREKIYKDTGKPFAGIGLEEVQKYQRANGLIPDDRDLDWESLRSDMTKYGLRNSLLIALMPTASTSSLLGNRESFEPFPRNIWKIKALRDELIMVNKHLVKVLKSHDRWNQNIVDSIIEHNGSVQEIDLNLDPGAEVHIKEIFKCAPEIKQITLAKLMLARQRFVCQTQSYNWFFDDPKPKTLNTFLMYLWKNGAKTGIYYLRTQPKVKAMITTRTLAQREKKEISEIVSLPSPENLGSCSGDGECLTCSS